MAWRSRLIIACNIVGKPKKKYVAIKADGTYMTKEDLEKHDYNATAAESLTEPESIQPPGIKDPLLKWDSKKGKWVSGWMPQRKARKGRVAFKSTMIVEADLHPVRSE